MKKYFIVLILGLFLGVCFARSAYAQENYFTPMKALQASNENSESKKEDSKEEELIYYYYEQYTYTDYEVSGNAFSDSIETKYAIAFENVKYSDINFTLTYEQPQIIYDSLIITRQNLVKFVESLSNNIAVVCETIEYCRLMGYEDVIIQSLRYLCTMLYNQYSCIQDYALKYLDAYKKEDFASCIKYILQIENVYWELYIQLGTLGNPDGTNQVSFT